MGCGSHSTVAVQSSFGTTWPTRDHHHVLSDKENSNFNVQDEKKISSESSKLAVGYSPLKSENNSRQSKTVVVNGDAERQDGDKISNFNIFVKELDEDKYKNDDGGVWVGNDATEVASDLERSCVADVNRNEEDDSSSDYVKQKFKESSHNEASSLIPEYATICIGGSDATSEPQHDLNETGIASSHEPLSAFFSQSSSKQKRHLHRHRVHFESVEDKFSYNFGHFVDEDKQMSDSELGDCEISLFPRETRVTNLRFSECNAQQTTVHGQTTYDKDLPARNNNFNGSAKLHVDKRDSPPDNSTVRNSREVDTDFKKQEKISEISNTRKILGDFPTCADNPLMPHFVFKCAGYIESVGLKTEGLYRIGGTKAQTKLFESSYLADPELDIAVLEIPVAVIATVLKNFFHDLKEALIPSQVYEGMVTSTDASNMDNQLHMLRSIVQKLPAQNLEVFKFIISHLSKVAKHQELNSMNSRNLAKCWWPALIRLQFESYEKLIEEAQVPEDIVQTFIEQCAFIFHEESDF